MACITKISIDKLPQLGLIQQPKYYHQHLISFSLLCLLWCWFYPQTLPCQYPGMPRLLAKRQEQFILFSYHPEWDKKNSLSQKLQKMSAYVLSMSHEFCLNYVPTAWWESGPNGSLKMPKPQRSIFHKLQGRFKLKLV